VPTTRFVTKLNAAGRSGGPLALMQGHVLCERVPERVHEAVAGGSVEPIDAPPRRRRRKKLGISSFSLPIGPNIRPGQVHGYYIDLRAKAKTSTWPPAELRRLADRPPVALAQWGLGAYERCLAEGREEWAAAAAELGRHLLATQQRGGPQDGGWVHRHAYPEPLRVEPPWVSGIAQGEGASLLVRVYRETAEEQFADAARRALAPMAVPSAEGGVRALLDGKPLPEEYPTNPPSHVLNGAIFALWGYYDVATGLDDRYAAEAFEAGVDGLAESIDRWDTGYWSRYDLYPHRVVNVASWGYHALHVNQLRATHLIAPRPEFEAAIARFDAYAASRLNRSRVLLQKVVFRSLYPRNRRFAERLPWAR
jgi:heparosan-N-sulfate-glucuronate 5-epimerase